MNRYPAWKYILIAIALVVGIFYTLPNFFPEFPRSGLDQQGQRQDRCRHTLQTVEDALKAANDPFNGALLDSNGVKGRLPDPDTQLRARDVLQQKFGDNYIVALNLLSTSPRWLASIGALPMYLGLDMRGGVHFLLQVDMKAALDKAADRYLTDIRSLLREKKVLYSGIAGYRQSSPCASATAESATRPTTRFRPLFPTCSSTTSTAAATSSWSPA
jgi:preprotein translocase subunit SecD